MRLAVLLIHYHTPELVREALGALRRDLSGTGLEVDWVLVDNGSDAAGRELLRSLPIRVLEPGRNLGYAGGINLGVDETRAEWIFILNPDVVVMEGCARRLLEALEEGAGVAGPRLYWDRDRRLLLPPAERRDRRSELVASLALRGGAWARLGRRRWRRHARRHWQGSETMPSFALSGAFLATSRQVLARVGPFDEEYRLYFEETDWLLRLRRQGLSSCLVPSAEATHLYAQSSEHERRAGEWFEASAHRFRSLHYGRRFASLLHRLAPENSSPLPPSRRLGAGVPELSLAGFSGPLWVEISPHRHGFPAAGERVVGGAARPWRLSQEVWERLSPGEYRLQIVSAGGRETPPLSFVKPHGDRGEGAQPP